MASLLICLSCRLIIKLCLIKIGATWAWFLLPHWQGWSTTRLNFPAWFSKQETKELMKLRTVRRLIKEPWTLTVLDPPVSRRPLVKQIPKQENTCRKHSTHDTFQKIMEREHSECSKAADKGTKENTKSVGTNGTLHVCQLTLPDISMDGDYKQPKYNTSYDALNSTLSKYGSNITNMTTFDEDSTSETQSNKTTTESRSSIWGPVHSWSSLYQDIIEINLSQFHQIEVTMPSTFPLAYYRVHTKIPDRVLELKDMCGSTCDASQAIVMTKTIPMRNAF